MRHELNAAQGGSRGRQPHIWRHKSEPCPMNGVTRRGARQASAPARARARGKQNRGSARRTRHAPGRRATARSGGGPARC
eukprot:3805206-Alexandrium_andersonii.AAC.1